MDYQLIKPIHDGYSAIEQVLTNRGIKFEDIDHYLNPSEVDNLSPLLLKNIESAAKMIFNQLSRDNFHIHVQVDKNKSLSTINPLNCGKPLRALTTKLLQGYNSGEVSDQGKVKSLRIGQPGASKPLEQRDVQRL